MLPYALIAIMINSLFASLIIGLIKDGRKITGLKYFPAILLISMLVVFISRYLMGLTLHIV
jgi:archaellum biogenesis protein FlaJ (TadC family)